MQMGMFNRAEKHFLDVLKVGADIIEAQNALAFVYAASKQHAKALARFNIVLAANPKHAHTHHNIANSLYALDRVDEAIEQYQAALAVDSKLLDSLIHCGMAYHRISKTDLAIECLHRALDQDKVNAKAFHVLGKLYADLKDYDRALDYLQNASNLAPDNLEFKLVFAKTLDEASLSDEAGLLYHQICEANLNYLEAFNAYAALLRKHRQYDEALECARRAEQIAPQDIEVREQLAEIYLAMGNTDEALNRFNEALTLAPNKLSVLKGIGTAYLETGKLTEATAVTERMIAIDNELPDGYLLKARVRKSTKDDGQAEQLLRLSQSIGISDKNKMLLNYALGKTFDDQKNYADAFTHYKTANDIKKKAIEYDKAGDEARVTKLIALFTPEFLDQRKDFGTGRDLPVLIIGMPRSGTTLTEQIISSHPDILGAGEVTFWGSANKAMPLRMHTKTQYPECLMEMTATHARETIEFYEQTLRKTVGPNTSSRHITDKMPHNFLHLGLIALLFPNVKFIHTKRDPIDTCLSIYFQHFNDLHIYAADLENLAFHYKQYERLMQHWHTLLPGRILDIHYEDTVNDPEYWSRQLISHIGLEWDDACLAPHKLERAVKTISQWQVRQPIYKTSSQRWKHYEDYIQPLIESLQSDLKS